MAPVTITATAADTANAVLDLLAVPQGNYLFTGQVTLEGAGNGRVVCEGRAPGAGGAFSGSAKARVGNATGAARAASLSIVFAAQLEAAGTAHIRCWEEDGTATDPSATAAQLVAVRTATLTR